MQTTSHARHALCPRLPLLPEACAMIRPASLLRAASDIAAALCQSDDDLRTELRRKQATIRALEGALDKAMARADQLEALTRLTRNRIETLESERAWKPWPPEVLDGRMVVVRTRHGVFVLSRADPGGDYTWEFCTVPAYVPAEGKP